MQLQHRACYDFLMISMLCHMLRSCRCVQPCTDMVTFSTGRFSRCPWKHTSDKQKRGREDKLVLEGFVISGSSWMWSLSLWLFISGCILDRDIKTELSTFGSHFSFWQDTHVPHQKCKLWWFRFANDTIQNVHEAVFRHSLLCRAKKQTIFGFEIYQVHQKLAKQMSLTSGCKYFSYTVN